MGANKGDWIEIDLGGSVQRGHLAVEMLQYSIACGKEARVLGLRAQKGPFATVWSSVQRWIFRFLLLGSTKAPWPAD
jgi:hypothetical protein